jgi:agmatinase
VTFFGIPSFAKVPAVEVDGDWKADVAILGVPYDSSAGYRPGARFGPRAIRDISTRFGFLGAGLGYWDARHQRRLLEGARVVDCGDVDAVPVSYQVTFENAACCVKTLVQRGVFPVVLGGDHSISWPVFSALESLRPVSLVHLDAHLDYRDVLAGEGHGHGSVVRRISEISWIDRHVSVGIRGLRTSEEDYSRAAGSGAVLVPCHMVKTQGVDATLDMLPSLQRTYVTIDIDVLDAALATGTGTPEVNGLTYEELRALLAGLAERAEIVGFDLVEVNPFFDQAGVTSLSAASLVIEFLGAIFSGR